MYGLGTPDDLNIFLENFSNRLEINPINIK